MDDASPEMMSMFWGALERTSPGDRAAYLDTACAHDPVLRKRIEALLRAHQDAGSFLPNGSGGRTFALDSAVGERPGAVIGPYKLLQQIGEGGMGTVYMAEQTEPGRRTVPLKIIKPSR